jgi:hypothetical protein
MITAVTGARPRADEKDAERSGGRRDVLNAEIAKAQRNSRNYAGLFSAFVSAQRRLLSRHH